MVGFGLFYALRPAIATIPFSGERFFTSDLSLSPANVLLVAIGIPAAAALTARIALRRVNVSPLGVTRRVTPRPPRARRLIPLLAGIAWLGYLAYFSDIADSRNSTNQAYAYLLGVFLIMIGLIVAGPWLTMVGSRLTARHAKRPTGLIAARRLGDNPHTAFRAISGVVLAVFLGQLRHRHHHHHRRLQRRGRRRHRQLHRHHHPPAVPRPASRRPDPSDLGRAPRTS